MVTGVIWLDPRPGCSKRKGNRGNWGEITALGSTREKSLKLKEKDTRTIYHLVIV